MALDKRQKQAIEAVIIDAIRKKLATYRPESNHMPFHYHLLGRDRMALYSFIHSLNTTFGISVFEPVAEVLAEMRFPSVAKQHVVGNEISQAAQAEITDIINRLSTGDADPDKHAETETIRAACNRGAMQKVRPVKADLCARDDAGTLHLFDLKTAKPNLSNFKDFKRTLLEWTAIHLARHPQAKVMSYIAIPYNPYAPAPYQRWTIKGMLDLKNELKVAQEFWDFLGGAGAYDELLDCFESAGMTLRPELDRRFAEFN